MGRRIKDFFKLFKSFLPWSFLVKVGYDVCVTIVYTNVLHYVHCKKTLSQNRTLLDSISRSEEILIVIFIFICKSFSFTGMLLYVISFKNATSASDKLQNIGLSGVERGAQV